MHIDLNSCFASVEQQANPLLRGHPLAVAAYAKPFGCILAPSIEAKVWGIKVGMTVKEARDRCPFLIVKEPDPDKYRHVHHRLEKLLGTYANHIISKSIDEFSLSFKDFEAGSVKRLEKVAREIKTRIQQEIGDWLRVSVGMSTNQILAKLASGLNKPDGLDTIDHVNYQDIYTGLDLKALHGINVRNEARLNRVGIYTVRQMYDASPQRLKAAFRSVLARYWYVRLRGWEIDDVAFARRSFGQSYVLPHPMEEKDWQPILAKLVEKGMRRMRAAGYQARGVHLYLRYGDGSSWHQGETGDEYLFDSRDIYKQARRLYQEGAPKKPVKKIAVSCFNIDNTDDQLNLLDDTIKKQRLVQALDRINDKWGDNALMPAPIVRAKGYVRDAIAFGK